MRARIVTILSTTLIVCQANAESANGVFYEQAKSTGSKSYALVVDQAGLLGVRSAILDAECFPGHPHKIDMLSREYGRELIRAGDKQHLAEKSYAAVYAREIIDWRKNMKANGIKAPENDRASLPHSELIFCLDQADIFEKDLRRFKESLEQMQAYYGAQQSVVLGNIFYLRMCPNEDDKNFGNRVFEEAVKKGSFSTDMLLDAKAWAAKNFVATEGLRCAEARIIAGTAANVETLANEVLPRGK